MMMVRGRPLSIALAVIVALAMLLHSAAFACTSFILSSADGDIVYARTMEFALPLHSRIIVVPRNLALTGTGPSGQAGSGLSWHSKYGVVGMDGIGLPIVIDGMNEAGLAGGALYLPAYAEYQTVPQGQERNSVASYELLLYILTNFATVAEVKAGVPKILVNRSSQAVFKMPLPLHLTVHDRGGASLVIEYVGGRLTMYDNPTGVMTNAPPFDWHLAHLGMYLDLSATEPKPLTIDSLTLQPPSSGAGSVGLPGDMTSPSRFVRAFLFSHSAPREKTSSDAMLLAFHILNNFDIVPGTIRTSAAAAAGGGVNGTEITEWSTVADLKTGRYYVRTFEDLQAREVDLAKVGLDGPAIRTIPLGQAENVLNLTP
jgi:choloylglycine hydrolase